jgi:hypothetical protein
LHSKWSEPAWIAELSESERSPAKVRFYLNLAAAYHNESALLTTLSRALDLEASRLNVCRQRGRVSPELAVKLESLLGADLFPRELFNPIFVRQA